MSIKTKQNWLIAYSIIHIESSHFPPSPSHVLAYIDHISSDFIEFSLAIWHWFLTLRLACLGFVLVSVSVSLSFHYISFPWALPLFPLLWTDIHHSPSLSLISPGLGKFRKQKVERAEPPEQLKEQYDGFLTPTEFKHHNYVEMER